MNIESRKWINNDGIKNSELYYKPQEDNDCKLCANLIAVQYTMRNLLKKNIYFDHKNIRDIIYDKFPNNWIIDWDYLMIKIGEIPTSVPNVNVKYGELKRFRNQKQYNTLTSNISRKLKHGTVIYFILKSNKWDILETGGNKYYTPVQSGKQGILGHASVIIGEDDTFYHCKNPWEHLSTYLLKKKYLLKIAGDFRYYNLAQ